MSLFTRLCSSSTLVGKKPLLSLGVNIHSESPLKNRSLPKHLHSSAILSLYKDTKPGRVRKHAESVNKKVAMMRRIGERMIVADKVEVRRVLGSHEVGVLSGRMCSPDIFTTQHICGPKWFNAWDGSNGVRPLGVHGSFCNPWSTLHSRPLALYGCSAQNLLQ